jgi:hypothetical protein
MHSDARQGSHFRARIAWVLPVAPPDARADPLIGAHHAARIVGSSEFHPILVFSSDSCPPPLSSPPSRSGPLLPWSDNDVGEMGVVAWGEMEAATRGETGVAAHHRRCFSSSPSVPSSLPPPIEQPQVPLSSRHTSTRQASRTVGGGEDTPICGSRGASVDDAHAHPTPAGGRNSDFSM